MLKAVRPGRSRRSASVASCSNPPGRAPDGNAERTPDVGSAGFSVATALEDVARSRRARVGRRRPGAGPAAPAPRDWLKNLVGRAAGPTRAPVAVAIPPSAGSRIARHAQGELGESEVAPEGVVAEQIREATDGPGGEVLGQPPLAGPCRSKRSSCRRMFRWDSACRASGVHRRTPIIASSSAKWRASSSTSSPSRRRASRTSSGLDGGGERQEAAIDLLVGVVDGGEPRSSRRMASWPRP